jgi:hypothetical protein
MLWGGAILEIKNLWGACYSHHSERVVNAFGFVHCEIGNLPALTQDQILRHFFETSDHLRAVKLALPADEFLAWAILQI